MKGVSVLVMMMFANVLLAQRFDVQVTEMAPMPEAVSNNAVCEGFANGTPYVYSFCGIDTSKIWSGIHLKSFRYNTQADTWETLPDVPDTLGKVAASANRVGDVVYVIGGYHVLQNGNEISSKSVHRFDTQNNTWLTDGEPIPIAIDDQVQAVYKDSLIYVITGWSNSNNVTAVQIYDTYNDSWQSGTSVPNNSNNRLFGGSGIIIDNTIYYFGGAKNGSFSAGNTLTIGEIDLVDPTQITWTDTILSSNLYGYRSACTELWGHAIWLGGSDITYNYNGIAYNGSGGVPPNNQYLILNSSTVDWDTVSVALPMDLRGVAQTSLFTRYLAGGMEPNQQVSDKTYKLDFSDATGSDNKFNQEGQLNIYPNPNHGVFQIENAEYGSYKVYSLSGQLQTSGSINTTQSLKVELPSGIYLLEIQTQDGLRQEKLIITK